MCDCKTAGKGDTEVTCNNINIFNDSFDTSLANLTLEMLDEVQILLVRRENIFPFFNMRYSIHPEFG